MNGPRSVRTDFSARPPRFSAAVPTQRKNLAMSIRSQPRRIKSLFEAISTVCERAHSRWKIASAHHALSRTHLNFLRTDRILETLDCSGLSCRAFLMLLVFSLAAAPLVAADASSQIHLNWLELPSIPSELGVAGPLVGAHNGGLIVAGGANFPQPVWERSKQWHDDIFVLTKNGDGFTWQKAGTLRRPLGYASCVSTEQGVLCMGGNDKDHIFRSVFMLSWDNGTIKIVDYPQLPTPCAYGQATMIGDDVYLAGGQSGADLNSAMTNFWRMRLQEDPDDCRWETLPAWPGPPRAFNLTVSQHNGFDDCVYVLSGRTEAAGEVQFLKDAWEFNPASGKWRRRADVPTSVMAGTSIEYGNNHIFVLGGADGSLFKTADDLKNEHPGFPKKAFAYHTVTDSWADAGATPANHVTTQAVHFDGRIVIPSGEVRPRVRSPKVWSVEVAPSENSFGVINYTVLVGYLAAMVAVGIYFANKNKNTDDYFRGGKQIPWWAAGCSIYATMLSSLTYTGLPSKAFQQDWVVAVMNFTVPFVSIVAVLVALPFYRRIDATSAYEYLERRFNRAVRLFGSASFALFHVFRMAVVLSLTGLALDVATPLTPTQCVLIMGILSIAYCTIGGIEAVIWTDTIQTIVLLGGALVAVWFLLSGVDGGMSGFFAAANQENKFTWAHHNFDLTSAQVALWAIVLGGFAQNVSSYTADQAVVQRYMTTASEQLAARSIWTNAAMVIPTTILFFGIGTALFAFYRSQPERLDPTITSDQIFPLFISRELPIGVAGLIVAGVFAAAQSTVSTSMNSMATTVVTDFLRPMNACSSEQGYLSAAKVLTLAFGIAGTAIGLLFVDPNIRSRFDEFIKVLGLFMGVLGGLFVLGALTRRANGAGAILGATIGAGVMCWLWLFTNVTGYIYTFCGISSCVIVGYVASVILPAATKDLSGLTIYTLEDQAKT